MIIHVTLVIEQTSQQTIGQTKDFIMEAVTTWGGQRHPDDPYFRSLAVKGISAGKVEVINGD